MTHDASAGEPDPSAVPSAVEDRDRALADVSSRIDGPVARLAVLQRSLLFAEVSMVAYLPHDDAQHLFRVAGFEAATFVERDGSEAYVLTTPHDRVVACRGTEPDEWDDLRAGANAFTELAETAGRVHRGFKRAVDDVWPLVREQLHEETRPLWFTGHSLGGAMATIMAGRYRCEDLPARRLEVFTFGSPRVGTQRYVQHAGLTHYRWVNNNDLVARMPPPFLGYRHTGTRMELDADGVHRELTRQERALERARGFRSALRRRRLDHVADHAIAQYVAHLRRNVD